MKRNSPTIDLSPRPGNILTLAAASLALVFAFAAFGIDVATITLTKAQLQNAADAMSMAAANALGQSSGSASTTAEARAAAAATLAAQYNSSYGRTSIDFDPETDLELGNYSYNSSTSTWETSWGTEPYNVARVHLERSTDRGNPLDLMFGTFVHQHNAELRVQSCAVMKVASGFKTPDPGRTVGILPITMDLGSWMQLEAGGLGDIYNVDTASNSVSGGSDGKSEIAIFPNGPKDLPSGNRGTLALGGSNNSTAKLSRQIRYGLSAADMEFHGGELSVDGGPIQLEGDPGVSGGIEDDLKAIIGQPRIIPIYDAVSGPGANCEYRIVKFVGIRVVAVDLKGKEKKLIVQPSPVVVTDGVRSTTPPPPDAEGLIYAGPPLLILPPAE